MNIHNLILILFLVNPVLWAMEDTELEEWVDDSIVPGASYFIKKVSGSDVTNKVCFYTFDGKLLHEMEHYDQNKAFYEKIERKLDSLAPKPRPISFKVIKRKGFYFICRSDISFRDQRNNGLGCFFMEGNHDIGTVVSGERYKIFYNKLDLSLINTDLINRFPWLEHY